MQDRSSGSKTGKQKDKIDTDIHSGHRTRLTYKALRGGMESLEEHEILEILLFSIIPRGNTNDIAHRLLNRFGSVYNIASADLSEILTVEGVGKKTAEFLRLLPMFVKAYELSRFNNSMCLDNPDALGAYCKALFTGSAGEEVYLLCLNINKRVIKRVLISRGGSLSVHVSVKEIVKQAAITGAVSVVLSHNHPNGILFPSQSDVSFTNEAAESLRHMDVALEDHIIVSGNNYFSFRKEKIRILY